MTEARCPGLDRSRQELDAARLLAGSGYARQAVSRAHFAAFGKRVVREGELDESEGRLLRSLFERRNDADYALSDVPSEEAARALADAERFVDAVKTWLDGRTG